MIGDILLFLSGILIGMFLLLGYMVRRLMRNDDWDDSNMTNALRLLSHVVLHPMDFGRLYYVSRDGAIRGRPFWYISKDELSEVVRSRPETCNELAD